MIKNLTETTIFQSWNSRLVDEVGFDVPLASFKELFRPIIFSLANFLSKVGGADITTSAVTISNTDGVFLCALLVNRTVDQENKTSFDVSFTTDKELVEESLRDEIGRALQILEDREKVVIEAYFGINQREMTLEEIGSKYNLTRERVRQIKEKAIRRLRQQTNSKILKAYLGQ